MKAKDLRNSILQLAVQGKLVPQDPNDEPASALLDRIRAERAKLIKEKKIKAPKGGESVIYRASDGSHYEKRGKGEPVCIDDEIPFEIPDSWEWARLESVCRVITDGDHQPPPQVQMGVPFLVISNVSSGSISFENTRFVPSSYYEALDDSRKPEFGDLLFTVTGSFGIPVVVRIDSEFCFQRHIALLKPLVDVDYLWWAVQSPSFFNYCDLKATGTAQRTVSLSTLRSGLLPIPPAAEQVRILSVISNILPLVDDYGVLEETRERLDDELPDRLRKSILQLAVQGRLVEQDPADEPASALLVRIRAERAALVKAKKLKAPKGGESIIYRASDGGYYEKRGKGEPQPIDVPFDIPNGWEWARVSSAFNLVRGTGIKRTEVIETGEPCVRYGELYTTYRNEITLVASHTSSTVYDKAQKLLNGEVVATLTGENDIDIGRAVVNNTGETVAFGGDLLALKGNYLDGNFAMLSLNAPYMGSQRTAAASGNIIVHLSADKIGSFLMAVPPLDEQRRIVGRFKELLAAVG